MKPNEIAPRLRDRIRARQHVLGTFIKMPVPHVTEMLGLIGFDFAIVDQEHAPLGIAEVDMLCLAARASGIAAIVRVPSAGEGAILSALDCGAAGVMVPHVDTPQKAAAVAAACRYRTGHRGFANTTRAGAYGDLGFEEHKRAQDDAVTCIAMIEDYDALDRLDAIFATPGIDCFFLGRGDLTAAGGPERAKEATARVLAAGRKHDKPVMALVASREDARAMREGGVAAFLVSNDQSLFKTAARQAFNDYRDPAAW